MSKHIPFTLYGWRCSYYTRKTLCYFRYKNINHVEKFSNIFDMNSFKTKVGARVMPVVLTPEGKYLQDSRDIIDKLEVMFPGRSVFPTTATPKKRIVSLLIEAWADDMWLGPAMHYRWSYPTENYKAFQTEVGNNLFPTVFVPRFIKNKFVDNIASVLRKFLPYAGVRPDQKNTIESWVESLCNLLDVHFEHNQYLLGDSASVGDFGLAGPLIAHLAHDPYPKEIIFKQRKHLRRWVETMQTVNPTINEVALTDEIPETLLPIIQSILLEYTPVVQATVQLVNNIEAQHRNSGKALPRMLNDIVTPFGESPSFKKAGMSFTLWKIQNIIDEFNKLNEKEQNEVKKILLSTNPATDNILDIAIPRVKRIGLRVKLV